MQARSLTALGALVLFAAACAAPSPGARASGSPRQATQAERTAGASLESAARPSASGRSKAAATPAASAPSASSAPSKQPDAKSDEPAEVFAPCKAGTPEHDAARTALKAVDTLIDALPPGGDPAPAKAALVAIFATPCFRVADFEKPDFSGIDSALSLRTFWASGGEWWLGHYLSIEGRPRATSVVPPSIRKTLARETHPTHALSDLLCPLSDAACGAETQGWAQRAQSFFEQWMELALAREAQMAGERNGGDAIPHATSRTCDSESRASKGKKRPDERYAEWRVCVEMLPLRTQALPLGRMKAPRDGWLVVRGRRGHYSFCDEVRAYDLATGAAYVSESCGKLVLGAQGGVDHAQTDAGRTSKVETGKLSVDNLREAAWMALLADEVQNEVMTSAEGFTIPDDMPVRRSFGMGFGLAGRASGSSAQTTLAWSYIAGGRSVRSGTLTWPEDYNSAAKEHAVRLLKIAEASLQPGCPPAALPNRIDQGAPRPGVSRLDATPTGLRATQDDLMQALDSLRGGAACPPGAARGAKKGR